jgi:bacterioferritin-associated ferredoxin
MIVCSCNVLTEARIRAAAEELAGEDPARPITPGRLFRRLRARPNCGTCYATIRAIVARAGLAFTCPEPLASVAEEAEAAADFALTDGGGPLTFPPETNSRRSTR